MQVRCPVNLLGLGAPTMLATNMGNEQAITLKQQDAFYGLNNLMSWDAGPAVEEGRRVTPSKSKSRSRTCQSQTRVDVHFFSLNLMRQAYDATPLHSSNRAVG